ncbi:hypothetical protein C8J57DRAFT_1215017 [Mycena rebaudengoi]|nr:hypothetical protein C8J57DRAFT_1215017 [Mycena rebaudengoi]
MQPSTSFENLIQYATIAATTAKEIADAARVPFLGSMTTLSLSIFKSVEIHEVLYIIVKLYSTSRITGVLSTALLYDIAKFTEALQKMFTFVKSQQGMGKIKQLFRQPDNVVKLETCKQELNHVCQNFKVHITGSTISQMVQMQKDTKQHHDELIALLAVHPDLISSDRSSVAGTLSGLNDSSESFSMLPSSPQIFHGRDSELQDTVKILVQDSAWIAILGTGGIGKTSLAMAALHDSQVEAKYSQRYFVPCHSSSTCTQLASAVADHIGVEKGSNLAQKIITMRGAERPAKVKWTQPFLPPLDPLLTSAALQTFIDVADDTHHQDSVKHLLEVTGNLPLAVSLISSVASHEGCDKALSRWKSESTHMLSDGYDQRSSLDISIMLSFTSSRMTAGAQDLLSLLSMLPDGLTDVELVQAKLGIPDVLGCKSILIQTSLAFVGKDQQLKVLVPIREHTLRMHPPTNSLKQPLQKHFHNLLDLWNQFQYLNPTNIAPQISHNLGNFDSVLQDALEHFPDAQNIQSILFLSRFYHRTQMTHTLLLSNLTEKMAHLKTSPMFGDYLFECFQLAGYSPIMDAEIQIIEGNEYFRSKDPLEQAKWSFALGTYFMWENTDMNRALDCFHHAVSLSDSTGSPSPIAERALASISTIMFKTGFPLRALEYAKKDEEYAVHLGDIYEQAQSLYLQSRCYQPMDVMWLPHGGQLDMGLRHLEAEIHLGKTEYLESHQIQISIISNLQLTQSGHHALMASLNMALIDISTGVDSKVILKNLEACGYHMRTFNTLSGFNQILTLHMLDLATANLNLRDGNHVAANTMFSLFLMDIMLECLEQLADLSTEMNNIQNTLRWAGIFLSLALISNEQLAMMKALSCLGQLTVAEGDDETALSLFTVALDGFTFMDVHCWRGDCMVRIADIYDKRGEPAKSVELWKTARPLFQRSSQANSVTWIDMRLSEVALAVSERHEKQLQQLAKMNVPVGELDETKIVDIDIDSADQNQIPSGLWKFVLR